MYQSTTKSENCKDRGEEVAHPADDRPKIISDWLKESTRQAGLMAQDRVGFRAAAWVGDHVWKGFTIKREPVHNKVISGFQAPFRPGRRGRCELKTERQKDPCGSQGGFFSLCVTDTLSCRIGKD
ncbi:hypothetical protein PoB_007001700 [Plakobranchus ocellatus]|uniref:Uncharacterized protein n=1 Tax=Plakobranchus ocellatus TaxID=259542 RepID=A0AAV4DGX9_9GAST|nr:hypothetical protein PoB_007001700 [Plakobranchus ocellatus]